MTDTYVLIHGAWHTGAEFEPTAEHMRTAGNEVWCPTLAGNRPGDDRASTDLMQAAASLVAFLEEKDLRDIRLMGHSYGGMVISQVASLVPERLRRLIYVNAFVPCSGECLNDLVPSHYVDLFTAQAVQNDNAVMLPFQIWREAFINDADLALAKESYARLNSHPFRTFTQPVRLGTEIAAMKLGKSYVNFQQDIAMPHSFPWHPRLSERLGLFRLVEAAGSHETCFTDPAGLAQAIIMAGRD